MILYNENINKYMIQHENNNNRFQLNLMKVLNSMKITFL